jgi:hypothetical protein
MTPPKAKRRKWKPLYPSDEICDLIFWTNSTSYMMYEGVLNLSVGIKKEFVWTLHVIVEKKYNVAELAEIMHSNRCINRITDTYILIL